MISFFKRWKRLGDNINDWYEIYKEYQKFDNRVVKVIKVNETAFEMEKIEGENLRDCILSNSISFEEKQYILEQIIDIFNNMFKFKHKNCHLFWHDDIQLKNFIYTKDKKIILLDPDSFTPIRFDNSKHFEFELGKFTNTIYNLHMSLVE